MSLTVKKGDNVVVLAGKDKGTTGKIISVNPTDKRVRVENVNMVSRHRKARSAQDVGGIVKMEGAIDVSNVGLFGKRRRARFPLTAVDDNQHRITGWIGKQIV